MGTGNSENRLNKVKKQRSESDKGCTPGGKVRDEWNNKEWGAWAPVASGQASAYAANYKF